MINLYYPSIYPYLDYCNQVYNKSKTHGTDAKTR